MDQTHSALGVICSLYDSFYDAEKKIADYMLEHKEAVVEMTVGDLAKASGTSDATVSRFCRKCGFKGFQHLKLSLARETAAEEKEERAAANEISRENISQSLKNILANKVAELTDTVNQMDTANLLAIIDKLEGAKRVQLAAVGNAIPAALDGAFKLNQLGISAVAGSIWEMQAAHTMNLGPSDVVLILSSVGISRRLTALARMAKKNGCTTIVITSHKESPLAQLCDLKLIISNREKLLSEETWFSQVTASAVIEMIYLLIRSEKYEKTGYIGGIGK